MANTYTQLHIHALFVVKHREALISEKWQDELFKYITGTVQNHNHKMLAINGMPDHIHMLIGLRPNHALSDLMQEIKAWSSRWINENKISCSQFNWQGGFAAFSISKSRVSATIDYIKDQQAHHSKTSFIEEYTRILEEEGIEYDDRYIFHPPSVNTDTETHIS
jgi:putative transposase